jgi:tripartite-type tricarboxylate transporter receptor subunit TctC
MFTLPRLFCFLLAASAVGAVPTAAHAQAPDYPSKPVRIVVPYAPGGAVDFVGRQIAQRLGEGMNQSVVVDNRPGAGAMIGIDNVAKAPADGYTLLVVDPALVINPSLQAKVPYKTADLAAVSGLTASPLLLTVNPKVPVKDMAGLISYAKANPGKVNFASAGIGTTPHMAGELLKLRAGAEITHIPYKGSGPAMADLVAGEVQMAFSTITAALPFVKDSRIRALATSGTRRASALPDLPTVSEAGAPNFEVIFWTGLFAPSGTPPAVLAKLNAETLKALQHPEMRAAMAKVSESPSGSSLADAGAFVKAESVKWAQAVKDGNIRGE